ncbi:5'-nucleotidase C-terminal domain-containing protein [bacterium]|nr:5'-nucleotidase C-terminal domain-containing protein [bacterium]
MINVPNINQSAMKNNTGTVNTQTQSVPANASQTNNTPNYTSTIYPQETVSVYNPAENAPKLTHTSWFYVNDVHGKMTNMERIYNISKEFDNTPSDVMSPKFFTNSTDNVSKFKVSSGDVILGEEIIPNTVASQFLNWSGFIASALGNHELDITKPETFAKFLEESNYKMLAANVDINPKSPLADKIHRSMITEKDGIKYGIIGIAPPDMHERVKLNDTLKDFTIYDVKETINRVQAEARKLKEAGINHIVVLSHGGNKLDKQLAQETQDIDIIFGAHTHNLIQGITEGENLLYSKTGEPVIITQAGKDGENLGILNVSFDQNGVIKKAQNNIIRTRDYNRPLFIKDTVEHILGKPEIVGRVRSAVPQPKNRLIENNPHSNLITDAMRIQLGTDIALLNAGNIRGVFSQGPIDTRLLTDISPFGNKMMILELTEKQIVDAIKYGLKTSLTRASNKPGLLLVSGLRYTGNKQGDLLELEFIDKNNQVHKIDVNNPDANKKYTVAADDFFATGGDGYLESNKNPDFVLQKFDQDKNVLARDYIKSLNQPIDIVDDKRIQII